MPDVPEAVAATIRSVFPDRGDSWLADLPDLIEDRCAAWDLEITGEAFGGGTHSFVAPVRRGDGSPAVLKLPVVDSENVAEATALHLYDGDGAVLLYEYHRDSGALLLEHADPGRPLVDQPAIGPALEGRPENLEKIALACRLYRRLWRECAPAPGFPPLPTVRDLVASWRDEIPAKATTAVPEHLVAQAVELCAEFAAPDGPEGLVNRDTHLGNIVSARREPWLLIDPKPLSGERAFDAGFLVDKQVQDCPEPAFACEVVARVADGLGVAPERARGWAFLRAVENAVWAAADDSPSLAIELAIAEALR